MSKKLNKNNPLYYADKTLLSGENSGTFLYWYTTVTDTPVGIAVLVSLVTNGIVKMFLKTTGRKKKQT